MRNNSPSDWAAASTTRPPYEAVTEAGPLQVERLMALAFFPGRAPRSAEYRQGCQAALEYRVIGRRMHAPYPAGCCEADAWFAGAEEGHAIWRRKCEAAAGPGSSRVLS